MFGELLKTWQKRPSRNNVFQVAETLAKPLDYGTLLIDGSGYIRSCGTAADDMFGGSLDGFNGKPISLLFSNFSLCDASLSYSVRHNANLCEADGWRMLEALDLHGEGFAVEINLSRVNMHGKDMFLLNLRRPEIYG